MPVPAPATALLVKDVLTYADGPAVELTTPTGAAIVTTLAESFGAMPAMNIESVGYGAVTAISRAVRTWRGCWWAKPEVRARRRGYM